MFEGVVGVNYRGDIAIDDFNFTTGVCGNPGVTFTKDSVEL